MSDPIQGKEVVGVVTTRAAFDKAIDQLTRVGFKNTDISVLGSHESIDAAGPAPTPFKDSLIAMMGELKYEGPLVAAGAIVLAGGPMAATLAAAIGAATAGIAAKELLDEAGATAHTEDFARAVEAGSIIVWVRSGSFERELIATSVLQDVGADNIHAV